MGLNPQQTSASPGGVVHTQSPETHPQVPRWWWCCCSRGFENYWPGLAPSSNLSTSHITILQSRGQQILAPQLAFINKDLLGHNTLFITDFVLPGRYNYLWQTQWSYDIWPFTEKMCWPHSHHATKMVFSKITPIFKMDSQHVLYSTWNSAQCYVAAWMGGDLARGWMRVHVWLCPFTVQLILLYHNFVNRLYALQNKK